MELDQEVVQPKTDRIEMVMDLIVIVNQSRSLPEQVSG